MSIEKSKNMQEQAMQVTKTEEVNSKANKSISGTKEWAKYSENCLIGCSHNCRYCYAKADAVRFNRIAPMDWKDEKLRPNILQKGFRKRDGTIMFPSSHDITPTHLSECLTFLRNILAPGNEVLIVSKPHFDCVKAICDEFSWSKDKILFRFTIGSSDSNTLKFWEPNAADFAERLESLKYAFSQGFDTSVSCEPMLDDNVGDVVNQVSSFVTDSIWIGKMNLLPSRLALNGQIDNATKAMAGKLIKTQSDDGFIWGLYTQYNNNPQIRWKASIREVIGLDK